MTATMVAWAALALVTVMFVLLVMIIKNESSKRAASIKAIERSIKTMSKEVTDGLKTGNDIATDINSSIHYMFEEVNAAINMNEPGQSEQEEIFEEFEDEDYSGEISFDFPELAEHISSEDIINDESYNANIEYITGRSGRKYTAEELEELIKE